MIVHNYNNIIMSGEAILSAENSGKPLGGRCSASAPNPAGRAHSAPPDPLAGGEGFAAPSPRTPAPLSVFGSSVLPRMKNSGHALAG